MSELMSLAECLLFQFDANSNHSSVSSYIILNRLSIHMDSSSFVVDLNVLIFNLTKPRVGKMQQTGLSGVLFQRPMCYSTAVNCNGVLMIDLDFICKAWQSHFGIFKRKKHVCIELEPNHCTILHTRCHQYRKINSFDLTKVLYIKKVKLKKTVEIKSKEANLVTQLYLFVAWSTVIQS